MTRSQFLAAVIVLAVLVGLIGNRVRGNDDGAGTEAAASAAPGADTTAATADASAEISGAIGGGEAAATAGATVVSVPEEPPPMLGRKPGLTGLDGWLQTEAEGFESFDGQVRIVQFWTFGCHNCKATIPHLREIYADWHPDGLEIIGVHAPEFDYEKDPVAIAEAAETLGVGWPIALDTGKQNFRSWQDARRFWPRTFVLDQNGEVRFDRIGEGKYEELARTVAYLIENGP